MIILHRLKNDSFADRIEEILKDLVLAYKTEIHAMPNQPKKTTRPNLPFIDENGTIISGNDEINSYLRQISSELKQQRAITGDGCYIDPKTGEGC